MQTEQHPDINTARAIEPVPALQLADREQLRASLRPTMSPGSFRNWLLRATRDLGFPEPIRTGRRSCAWSVTEVSAWLAGRPRKGVFAGRRPGKPRG
jgi:hypothetical protein